jgi:small subunit ribosomal protein S18
MRGRKKTGRSDTKKSDGPIVRKRSRYLEGVDKIDSRDYELLRKFVTEHGKIMPARLIGASARQQRQIKRAVRRARTMGVLP